MTFRAWADRYFIVTSTIGDWSASSLVTVNVPPKAAEAPALTNIRSVSRMVVFAHKVYCKLAVYVGEEADRF